MQTVNLTVLIEAVEALKVGAFALPPEKRNEASRLLAAAHRLQPCIEKVLENQKIEVAS